MTSVSPKPAPQLPKPVLWAATVIYGLLSLLMYWYCYSGYAFILSGHFDPWVPVALICFTVMFRLDIIVAVIGFYGAWKGEGPHFSQLPWLHIPQPLPTWEALLMAACFMGLSYLVNMGSRAKPRRWLVRQLWRRSLPETPAYVPGTGYGNQAPNPESPIAPPVPEAVVDPNAPKTRAKKSRS